MEDAVGTESEPVADVPTSARSTRWPWTRAGLSLLIVSLLPFTWVVQIDGCTQTVQGTRSGIDLFRNVQATPLDLALLLFLGALVLAAPRWSGFARSVTARVGLHVAGLVATASLVFTGLSVVFGGAEIRAIQPAGYLALGAILGGLADAMARVALGVAEWSEARRGSITPAASPQVSSPGVSSFADVRGP